MDGCMGPGRKAGRLRGMQLDFQGMRCEEATVERGFQRRNCSLFKS